MIPNQIRLDAGYITLRDLDSHPSWEPCLDEVGVDDQTECTIRPFKPKTASLRLTDYCLVACDFITRRKRTFVGWITLGTSNTISPWDLTPEIMLDGIDESVSSDPNANSIPSVVCTTEATTRIGFSLPESRRHSDEKLRPKINFAYTVLQTTPEDLFPITVTPNQTIRDWPGTLVLNGFYRPTDERLPPIR